VTYRPAKPKGFGKPKRQRRALSHVGGRVQTEGDPSMCKVLSTVMGGELDADSARAHVHGFHAYPARMHPTLARRCVELLAPPKGSVLDPFCGSGTVLVEARLAGRPSRGTDLNPLAVLLSQLKTYAATDRDLDGLVASAARVAEHAESRRKERRGATKRYSQEDVRLFDPHVLLELDGLRQGLDDVGDYFAREALRLVFSAILMKVSRQTGDTSGPDVAPKRLATGYTIKLFERKAQELARRMASFRSLLAKPLAPVTVSQGDARQLQDVADASVDLALSSPPYAGTYDYVEHHRTRLRWLGLPIEGMEKTEIGARRHLERLTLREATDRFSQEMTAVFHALHRVLRQDGHAVLVIADSVVAGKPVWADPLIRRCAEDTGLRWLATASQVRPNFHGPSHRAFEKSPRREHTIVLVRPSARV